MGTGFERRDRQASPARMLHLVKAVEREVEAQQTRRQRACFLREQASGPALVKRSR